MLKTVWKYPIPIPVTDDFILEMPRGARPLCVQIQRDEPNMWALVSPDQPTEARHFRIAGTGHPIEYGADAFLIHIDTFQLRDGYLVFHLFEILPIGRPE